MLVTVRCVLCFRAACESVSGLHSLIVEFLQRMSSVTDIISDLADAFLVCCVVVVVACVADRLLLRMLRACAVVPTRLTYVVTPECARELDLGDVGSTQAAVLDLGDVGSTEAALQGPPCDGQALSCRDSLMTSPTSQLHLLKFSETKV